MIFVDHQYHHKANICLISNGNIFSTNVHFCVNNKKIKDILVDQYQNNQEVNGP